MMSQQSRRTRDATFFFAKVFGVRAVLMPLFCSELGSDQLFCPSQTSLPPLCLQYTPLTLVLAELNSESKLDTRNSR